MKYLRSLLWAVASIPASLAHAQNSLTLACEALVRVDVPITAIRLPVGGIAVQSAVAVGAHGRTTAPNGELILDLPQHCRVQGAIAAVDPAAPAILFNVNLPLNWNGKALQSGGGGLGGNLTTAPGMKASGRFDPQPYTDAYPLTEGYVTFGGDEGHQGGDVAFIYNDEALRNWGQESFVKVRDVAVALIERAYDRAPERVYFSGESAGGREALMMAQRFPQAYDGIIAVTPVLGWTYTHIADNQIRSRLIEGWLDEAAISLIADKTRELCDGADGLVDGIVGRYMECRMDSQILRCPNGTAGSNCLSDAQIASLDSIRQPWAMSVPMAHGMNRFPGYGITGDEDGEENQWSFYMVGTVPPEFPLPPGRGFKRGVGAIMNFAAIWVRHAIAQDENFEPHRFYPPPYTDRIQYLSALFDATDPDLSGLRQRGGKLLIMQQSADNAVSTIMVADYYRSVVSALGRAAADEVMRLYVGPGGTHNGNGVAQTDMLGLLEAWVEAGEAPPDAIPVHHIDPNTHELKRSMLACAYPKYTRYNGTGDTGQSSSFRCAERPDPLAFSVHSSR